MQPLCRASHKPGWMQSGFLDWQKRIERVQRIISLEIEPMRWQNPVSINQSEEGDLFYVRVPPMSIVTALSLAFCFFFTWSV
jgi:hypothetical protein